VEALARWRAPGGAWVPPAAFIGVAEREGLIGELSQILFAKALTEGAQLHDAGFALTIAVNLSGLWLREPNVLEFLVATTHVAGLRPTDVMLELNCVGVMEDPARVLEVLTHLRLKGFGLSMADFGLGTSPLQTAAHLPWSELKLHRSFLLGGQQDAAQRALLERSMAMARQLQLGTIAEGVESPGELAWAQSLGCDGVQGYFLAKPMPIADTRNWLIAQEVRSKSPG
jgi:EAL domain-containing protein (putative c-di-GMP-specific phosphodiesterase class I)